MLEKAKEPTRQGKRGGCCGRGNECWLAVGVVVMRAGF